SHCEVLLQRRQSFGSPRSEILIICALCCPLELSNISLVDFFEPLQIECVKISAAQVLRPDATHIERDAFFVGQRGQLAVEPGMFSRYSSGDILYLRTFCLALGHFSVRDFLRSAAGGFLDKVYIVLTHFHRGGCARRRLWG